jgi:hypothetical protein
MAMVRDNAVQKLRDLTIAVALAAAAAVGIIAWVSAATIPGTAGASVQSGNPVNESGQPFTGNDDGFNQGPVPGTTGNGPGIVVTGGSHP